MTLVLFVLGAFVGSLGLTWGVRWLALRHDLVDHPVERSSHTIPTPRGGGLAIVLSIAAAGVVIGVKTPSAVVPLTILLIPFGLIALLGLADDRIGLSARLRLIVQFICAVAVVTATVIHFDVPLTVLKLLWLMVLMVAIVWCTNFYNFMDGIDGIAGSQGVFVAAGAAILLCGSGGEGLVALLWATVGACAGFLVWNWSPARIFMGDVGSAALGFLFGSLAAYTSLSGELSEWVWLLLLGAFAVDATVTLAVRAHRRESLAQAHRSHAYQRLARRFGRHSRAVIVFVAVNVCWLLPWSIVAAVRPGFTPYVLFIALAPLVWAAVRVGAGHPDAA